MKKQYTKKATTIISAEKLLKEANKINLERSTNFDENKLYTDQYKEFRVAVAKEIQLRSQLMEQQASKIGGLLCSAKITLPHTEFSPWVEENCPFDHRTANNLMNLYKVTFEHPALMGCKKTVLYHLGSKNCPDVIPQMLEDSIIGVHDLKLKDVLQLQTSYLNGDLSLDSKEFQTVLKKQKKINLFDRWKVDWKSTIKMMERKKDHYDTLLSNQRAIAGPKFKNEYTAYWKSSKSILSNAINKFNHLCEGNIVEEDDKDSNFVIKTQHHYFYYDESCIVDERNLLDFTLTPDDMVANYGEDEKPEQFWRAILCPEDFNINDNGGCAYEL